MIYSGIQEVDLDMLWQCSRPDICLYLFANGALARVFPLSFIAAFRPHAFQVKLHMGGSGTHFGAISSSRQ